MDNDVTRTLARFASELTYEGIPPQVSEYTKHLLLDALGVLGGELELGQRVAQAGADSDRVEQGVLAVPGPLLRFARYAHEAVVKRHDSPLVGLFVRRVLFAVMANC